VKRPKALLITTQIAKCNRAFLVSTTLQVLEQRRGILIGLQLRTESDRKLGKDQCLSGLAVDPLMSGCQEFLNPAGAVKPGRA